MKKRTFLSVALSLLMLSPVAAKTKSPSVLDVSRSITDEAIIYPESFEIDTQKLLEGWYLKNYTATDDSYRSKDDPNTSDEVIIRRLQAMPTVIEMPYNQIVRSYIDRYTKRGRAQVAAMLGLSLYYMPIFEQALEQEGLPLELKYLPIIESGLDPNAVSKSGAAGLWQFMLASAKGLGMDVNSLVDERRDPYISSAKAAKFLKDLYATYGDWSLSIAAYNCGPVTVNKAIRRAGGEPKNHDFWSIYNYLPAETRGYVPAFIAANYVMTYYKDHNINPVLQTKPLITDTVAISDRIHFEQISSILSIPVDELKVLNPQFRQNIIPGTPEKPYYLILPSQQIHAYIMSENEIKNYNASKYAQRATVEPGDNLADVLVAEENSGAESDNFLGLEGPSADAAEAAAQPVAAQQPAQQTRAKSSGAGATKTIMHKVANGETIASIAAKYGVQVSDIKEWNGLRRSAVRQDQQLKIIVAANSPAANPTAANPSSASRETTSAATTTSTSNTKALASGSRTQQQQKVGKHNQNNKKKTTPAKPSKITVQSGENLTTLARKHGTTVDELKRANNMSDDKLRAGQELKIPAKKSASTGKSSSKKSGYSKSKVSSKKSKRRR